MLAERALYCLYFYPRPRGGGRPPLELMTVLIIYDFYPRPPGGGRLFKKLRFSQSDIISIHALRVEGDSNAGGY